MQKFVTRFILFAILVSIVSCNSETKSPQFPPIEDVDIKSLNKKIRLSDKDVDNSFKNGETLSLVVTNISDTPIVFSDDFGAKIFSLKNKKWVEVKNNYMYSGNPGKLPPKKDVPIGFVVKMKPYLPDMLDSQSIRIVVIGYPENDKNNVTGAFVDITLYP